MKHYVFARDDDVWLNRYALFISMKPSIFLSILFVVAPLSLRAQTPDSSTFSLSPGGVWLDHGELDQIMGQQPGNTRNDGIGAVAELTVEALGSILEFVGDALSGL